MRSSRRRNRRLADALKCLPHAVKLVSCASAADDHCYTFTSCFVLEARMPATAMFRPCLAPSPAKRERAGVRALVLVLATSAFVFASGCSRAPQSAPQPQQPRATADSGAAWDKFVD